MATTTTTTTTTTLNVVSLPVSLAPATGSFSGPACIILNTTGATLSQVQQQHPQLLVNSNNEKDYHQTQHLQQQQEKPQLDRNHHHHHNNNNNNNNNININNIGTTANNGTVVGVVGVGELVGLVGVGPPVVNVPACPTSNAATVTTNILAAPPTSETSTSTAAVALRLTADPPVTIPAVLRPVSAPAPITTNVTTSNVILNVSRVLNNHSTTTTTTTTNNNNNNNFKSYNNNNINNIHNHTNDNNNNFSHINNNSKKMKSNISKTSCGNGFVELPHKPLLPTLQQPYQQNQNQHQPELLRCKRRIDFSGLGFTLPRAQPAAVARRNERERNRVKLVNLGFEALREHVPNGRKNKKMSKVETLRAAVQYIKELQELLHHEPDFLDISDLEVCAAAAAAAAQLTSSVSVTNSTVSTCITSKSISPPPNSDISCSPSSSLCSDSGSSCDPFNEDDLIDFSRLL